MSFLLIFPPEKITSNSKPKNLKHGPPDGHLANSLSLLSSHLYMMKPFYVDTRTLIVLRKLKSEVILTASSITRSAKATVNDFLYICGQKLELHFETGSYLDDT